MLVILDVHRHCNRSRLNATYEYKSAGTVFLLWVPVVDH